VEWTVRFYVGRCPKRVVKLAFELGGSMPEESSAFVKERLAVSRGVVGEVGIKPE
jgi:hypothetical protein